MSRPEYPNCIMTTRMISHIRQAQEAYDANPEYYERREQERIEEQQRLEDFEYQQYLEEERQRLYKESQGDSEVSQ